MAKLLTVCLLLLVGSLLCEQAFACAEGERKYDGCNWCTCVRGGWVCTAKFCGRSAAEGGGDAPLV